jgi:hypothetical protein
MRNLSGGASGAHTSGDAAWPVPAVVTAMATASIQVRITTSPG